MKDNQEVRWIRLGEFIEQSDKRNVDESLKVDSVRGLATSKQVIETKANMEGVSLKSYKLLQPNEIAYVSDTSRRGDKVSLGYNESNQTFLVSSISTVIRIKAGAPLLPEYLHLWYLRPEFDRYARFNSWGSARETFPWNEMCRMKIPVPYKDGKPDLEKQQEVVDIWKGLKQLKEENEALAEPLLELCQSKIEELKASAPMEALGPYIKPCDERNSNLEIKLSQGISNLKVFQNPKQVAVNSKSDKIVRTGQFAYNRATTRNGEKISIAYREGPDCTVSSAYQIFELTGKNDFLPHYLMLWFMRPEFDRYARYMSKGSAHEFFEYDEMCRVKVPKPSIEVQRAIVDIYLCAKRAKEIAEEADQQLKTICPALMQYIIHG